MVENRREETSRVAETEDGDFMRGEALDDVVDGNVRGPTDEDAKVALEHLKNQLDQGVCFSSLT